MLAINMAFGHSLGHVTSFSYQGMKIGAAHTPLDSGAVSGFGECFRRKDEVGSPCGRRWWYRG